MHSCPTMQLPIPSTSRFAIGLKRPPILRVGLFAYQPDTYFKLFGMSLQGASDKQGVGNHSGACRG